MSDKTSSTESALPEGRPDRIGPYRIFDTLGEGGMAIVYLAEQAEPVKRQVALKILKPGMDSKQVLARFHSEERALAVLDHPNIAKVFDGGITKHGRPYFVMERVRGIPITDYCDTHRVSTEGRIKLFVSVCSAVQHAHHKGLIHRDLKPSNLLVGVVDGEPQAKIIDFGIAKATSPTLGGQTLYTKIGQLIGTPQYMSPEQADITGLDVDTRADIYSLGVVLYELLVGAPPLDLVAIGDQAVKMALLEKDPARPSTRITQLDDTKEEIAKARNTDASSLRRELAGDLDWIVMRAIEKDRTRRYETANAFAMDCRRFLDHQPVLARPPRPGYLLARFVRRNRVVVAATTVAAVAIIGGAVAATVGFVRASEAEQVAVHEAATANRVSDFLIELFRVSDPSEARGNTITAREILDRGAEDIGTELVAEPKVRARLMETIGTVYLSLGLTEPAQRLLDEALSTIATIYGADGIEYAGTQVIAAELERFLGNFEKSEELLRQSLDTYDSQLSPGDARIGAALEVLGQVLYYQGRHEEAEAVQREALDIFLAKYGEGSIQVAGLYSNLGSTMDNMERYEEAEQMFKEALEINRNVFGEYHPGVAAALNNLALVYEDLGRMEEAVDLLEEAVSVHSKVYNGEHALLAESQAQLAGAMGFLGRIDEAVALYQDSIAMLKRTVGREHELTARAMDSLGVLYLRTSRYEEAEPLFLQSVELYKSLMGERHVNTGRALNNLAALMFLSGDYARAEPYFRESLSIREETQGDAHTDVANSRNNLADVLNRLGRYEEAEPLASQAAEGYAAALTAEHWRSANARNIHARSLVGLGRLDEAEPVMLESLAVIRATVTGAIYHKLALQRAIDLYTHWGRSDAASEYQNELRCLEDMESC
jgi:eukaryotic-like serine/threonine-protein kinase